MINRESIERELKPLEPGRLFFPDHRHFCFSGIPGSVERLLLGSTSKIELPSSVFRVPPRAKAVVLILFDAFGWHSYQSFGKTQHEVNALEQAGMLSKLTSQFPSTTAAHVSTLFSGEPVCRHGIYEWFIYEPLVDRVIAPLPFMFAGEKRPDSLKELGFKAEEIFAVPSFAQGLAASGVRPVIFQDAKYALSSYSQHMLRGAEIVPYNTVEEGLNYLVRLLNKVETPSFFYFYIDRYDTASHETGPLSEQSIGEARRIFKLLGRRLYPVFERSRDLTLLLTADHGQCEVSPQRVCYFNEELPDLAKMLKRNRAGELIPFAGSSRDLFLHVEEGSLDAVHEALSSALDGRALVARTDALVKRGLFCEAELSPALAARIGNLVILPFEGDQVYYRDVGRFEALFRGHHGGLARSEIEIPFFVLQT